MVEVLFAVMVVGEIEVQLRSDGTSSVRTTPPLNPRIRVTVIVAVVFEPTCTATGWVEDIVKSGGFPKVNDTMVEWVREPLVAVIGTLYMLWVVELQDRV